MSAWIVCLGMFLFISFLATIFFVGASMNSSRISQREEGYESEPDFRGHPLPREAE